MDRLGEIRRAHEAIAMKAGGNKVHDAMTWLIAEIVMLRADNQRLRKIEDCLKHWFDNGGFALASWADASQALDCILDDNPRPESESDEDQS